MAVPTYGIDATGQDAYATVIAAQTEPGQYNYFWATCATQNAILSFDAGTTDHVLIPAGDVVTLPIPRTGCAVKAKNATAGLNYATLVVNISLDEG
jgi:hypothetical protein